MLLEPEMKPLVNKTSLLNTAAAFVLVPAASPEESCLKTSLPESITARRMPGTVCRHVSPAAAESRHQRVKTSIYFENLCCSSGRCAVSREVASFLIQMTQDF